MKATISIVLLFLASICKEKPKIEEAHFDFIEITRDNGWSSGTTIYIDSNWIITRCDYHIISKIDTASCYIDTLDIELRQLINLKIDQLKMLEIDTLYDGNCQDCGGYLLRLGFNNRIFKSIIIGTHKFNNELSSFSRLISSIMINQNHMDSIIVFETTKLIIPPGNMMPTRKFIPPPDSLIE
jgi:hypothetical protein